MQILKLLYLITATLIRQAFYLPKEIAIAVKQRRRQGALNEREAERLDRIRNPSKYLGK
jgi:hypothetical protein